MLACNDVDPSACITMLACNDVDPSACITSGCLCKQGSHRTGKSGKSREFENKHSRSGKDLKFDLIRKNPGNNWENC